MYFPRPLSKFRVHDGNEQRSLPCRIRAIICWALVIREAMERNIYLHDSDTRRKAVTGWLRMASEFLRIATMTPDLWDDAEFRDLLCVFAGMSEALRNDCRIAFDIDTTLVLHMDEG